MTHTDFRAALKSLGLSQSDFAREVERIGGQKVSLRQVQRWATGETPAPAILAALMALWPRAARE